MCRSSQPSQMFWLLYLGSDALSRQSKRLSGEKQPIAVLLALKVLSMTSQCLSDSEGKNAGILQVFSQRSDLSGGTVIT